MDIADTCHHWNSARTDDSVPGDDGHGGAPVRVPITVNTASHQSVVGRRRGSSLEDLIDTPEERIGRESGCCDLLACRDRPE